MFFYPKDPSFCGVEALSSTMRIAIVSKKGKTFKIEQLREIQKEEIANLADGLTTVTALASKDVLVRTSEVAATKEKDVRSAVEFQIEPQLPFPLESSAIALDLLEKKKASTRVSAFIVKKSKLHEHLNGLSFIPEKVTCIPSSIAAFSFLICKAEGPLFWVHVGEDEVTVAYVQQGKLLAARAFDKNLDVGKEVQKTILRMESLHKGKSDALYVLGNVQPLMESISKETGKAILAPALSESTFSQEDLMRFGLCIGIALCAQGPNFREKEFSYPYPLKRYKKPLFFSLALFMLFSGILFGAHKVLLSRQKEFVQLSYQNLMQQEGKPESLHASAPADYLMGLAKLEKEIQSRPDTYPLYPQVPKVKELLAWISTMANLAGKQNGIDIQTIHYSMVSRPDFSKKKEHYKIKVEVEFTSENPNDARHFQDAMLGNNTLIDTKEEFKWNVSKGKYRAEFFLKDKTRYY